MNQILRNRITVTAGILLTLIIGYLLRDVLTPFLFAFILAYILNPAVELLERWKLSRSLSISIILFFLSGIFISGIIFIVPIIQSEISILIKKMPGYFELIKVNIIPYIEEKFKIRVPATTDEIFNEAILRVRGLSPETISPIVSFIGKAFSSFWGIFGALLNLIIIPVVTIYLLKDFKLIKERVKEYIPMSKKQLWIKRIEDVNTILGKFLRGQLLIAFIEGVIFSIGLSLIGIDMAILVGIMAGLGSIVPYLGFFFGISVSIILSLLEFHDFAHILWVLALFGGVQVLEAVVLSPKIMGKKVGLHPVIIILSIMIGGYIFGFFGILLAVPFTAIMKVFLTSSLESYRKSAFYLEE
jgi:predicted PurR-regulated permease PerM